MSLYTFVHGQAVGGSCYDFMDYALFLGKKTGTTYTQWVGIGDSLYGSFGVTGIDVQIPGSISSYTLYAGDNIYMQATCADDDVGDTGDTGKIAYSPEIGANLIPAQEITLKAKAGYYWQALIWQNSLAVDMTIGNPAVVPTVVTNGVSPTTDGAIVSGNVTSDGWATITERGICWISGTGIPYTNNNKAIASGTTGAFTANVVNYSPSSVVSVRTYAQNSVGLSYGNKITFITDGLKTHVFDAIIKSTTLSTQQISSIVKSTTNLSHVIDCSVEEQSLSLQASRGSSSTLPAAPHALTSFTELELQDIETSNDVRVSQSGSYENYSMFEFSYYGSSNTQFITLSFEGNSSTNVDATFAVYNWSKSRWEIAKTQALGASDSTVSVLIGNDHLVNNGTTISEYYGTDNEVAFLVYSGGGS